MDFMILIHSWLRLKHQLGLFFPKLVAALCVLVLFWITANICKKIIQQIFKTRNDSTQAVFQLISEVVKVTIVIIGIISSMSSLGININALVASLGLSGFALGFALKDLLSNVLAGMMILIYKPFKLHDEIEIKKMHGKVTGINLRYTTLRTDNSNILIPNSILLTSSVTVKLTNE